MKSKFIITIIALSVGLWTGCQNEQMDIVGQDKTSQGDESGIVPGVLNIKFKAGTDVKAIEAALQQADRPATRTGISAMDLLNGKYKVKEMKRIFPYSPKFEKRHEKHGLHLWYRIEVDTTLNTRSVAESYLNVSDVEIAVPAYQIRLLDNSKPVYLEEVFGLDNQASPKSTLPFNDTHLGKQWHYDKGDLNTPLDDANIGLFPAWEISTGDPDVLVAVMDGGVDYNHEDLAANMWHNPQETFNGKDDDNNGYVDDLYGYNFVTDRGKIDVASHGTHVAGTVAAVNNNNVGVCGVAGGSGKGDGVRIMSCQIFGSGGGTASGSGQAAAFVYAADNGAVISQNSWGYSSAGFTEPAVEDAINYFIEEAGNAEDHPNSPMRGGIVIFAAGNDGAAEKTYYPCAYPQVLAVTSTDYRNERASLTQADHSKGIYYANVASWVDICAPGGMNDSPYGVLSTIPDNKYGYMSGTSMACPHVSGVAALIVSRRKGPEFTCEQLKEILLKSVMDITEYEPRYARWMGAGLIRADLALVDNDGIAPDKVDDLAVASFSSSGCELKWSVTKDQGDGTPKRFHIYYSTTEITAENYTSAQRLTLDLTDPKVGDACQYTVKDLEAKQWFFAVAGEDEWGNLASCSNVVSQWLVGANEAKVFPTVVTETVNVVVGSAFTGGISVSIYDAAGNRVLQQQFADGNMLKVSVAGLSSGVYTLKIKSGGADKSARIVKK